MLWGFFASNHSAEPRTGNGAYSLLFWMNGRQGGGRAPASDYIYNHDKIFLSHLHLSLNKCSSVFM